MMRFRTIIFLLCLGPLLPSVYAVAKALPAFGAPTALYGPTVNAIGPKLRHVSNMVSAVNFDFRGLDTLGEETMLVAAVTGAAVLLRTIRDEESTDPIRCDDRPILPPAESTTLVCRIFGPLILLFGLYMAVHVTATPGGGFQGGVVIASGLLLIFLGKRFAAWHRAISPAALDLIEGVGLFIFVIAGLAPMISDDAFLQNTISLGTFKDVFSGGLMLIENAGVLLAVAAGFATLFFEFIKETRAAKAETKA